MIIYATKINLLIEKLNSTQIKCVSAGAKEQELFDGAVKLVDLYFGDVHKGKHDRGPAGELSSLKRCGRIYIKVVNDTQTATSDAFDGSKESAR